MTHITDDEDFDRVIMKPLEEKKKQSRSELDNNEKKKTKPEKVKKDGNPGKDKPANA